MASFTAKCRLLKSVEVNPTRKYPYRNNATIVAREAETNALFHLSPAEIAMIEGSLSA